METKTIEEQIWKRVYRFDTYFLNWTNTLRISRKIWNKLIVVKVYTWNIDWKIDEFIKSFNS